MEDKPGIGKTTLSQALAKVLGLEFSRIQVTSDLLSADISDAVKEFRNKVRQFHLLMY